MDKTYQDIHLCGLHGEELVLRKCMLTCISFTEDTILIHMNDDVGREQLMIFPKLHGYKLVID